MKYIKLFEDKYLDDLLDKISKSGYNSLSSLEKDWLKAHASDEDTNKIEREMGKREFKSSNNLFSFTLIEMEDYGDEKIIKGTLYTPSIEFEGGHKIEGVLEGYIEVHGDVAQPNFQKEYNGHSYDVYEFCNGLEYELDSFIHDIVDELNMEE